MKSMSKIAYYVGTVVLAVLEFATMVFITPAFILAAITLALAEWRGSLSFVTQERSDCVTEGEDDAED